MGDDYLNREGGSETEEHFMRINPDRKISQTGQKVEDFWAWAFSDVLSNINRAVFAEWLVGSALGCVDGVRPIWAPWDLDYVRRCKDRGQVYLLSPKLEEILK